MNPGFDIRAATDPLGWSYGPGTFGPAAELRLLDAIRPSLRDPKCAGPEVVYAIFATGVAAIGGFLFGYDTAVINGANTYLKAAFQLTPAQEGIAGASAILGCIPGAMFAGSLSDRFGRRKLLFFCALLFALSGMLSAVPRTFTEFLVARFIGGLGIGASSMICPVYIAEIAPEKWRGRLGSLFQLGIVTGILLTLFVNAHVQGLGDEAWNTAFGWRWMLGLAVIPAITFIGLLFAVPESPRWLAQQGRGCEARTVLTLVGGEDHADQEMMAIQATFGSEQGRWSELLAGPFRRPLIIAVVLMACSQFCGINAIMYYSTKIFATLGGGHDNAFASSVWVGAINLVFYFCGHRLRRPLGPQAAAAYWHDHAGPRARDGGMGVPHSPARSDGVDLRRCVHRRLRDGDGADRLVAVFGNFP